MLTLRTAEASEQFEMRLCVVLLAGVLLISGAVADEDIDASKEHGHERGACDSFGKSFCSGPCKEPPGSNDTFLCECPSDQFYFNAAEQMCLYKKSCKTTKCGIGYCIEDRNRVFCSCKDTPNMTLRCKVESHYQEDCEKKGGLAVIPLDWSWGPRCDCGDWAVMDKSKKKCVPTTCLKPNVTCKELCEKRLLRKDDRCCQGWNEADCTKEPENDTYCSPGSLRNQQGECQDACSLKAAKLICANGCEPKQNASRAYECICPQGTEVSEDGISCRAVHRTRICRDDEKQACRSDQSCWIKDGKINCGCRIHEHLVDGICTGKCAANVCHERFLKCVIYNGKQECACPWRDWSRKLIGDKCTLHRYYYTASFNPNISLVHEDCDFYVTRVRDAMKTALGSRVHDVEILNCTDKIKARLILNEPLPQLLKKKLQTCEYQEEEFCMLYPQLPIEKGSATEIEEENLCDGVLKEQETAYNGTNKCVKDGNLFWFKCAPGYREVKQETLGRLRRSICEPTKDSTAEPATNDTTAPPDSKSTTAEPGESSSSSHFKPQFLQLLFVYGGLITLLRIAVH